MNDRYVSTSCLVCGAHIAHSLFDGGERPLATLAWPNSRKGAEELATYPLRFVQCPDCSHIWNYKFKYEDIPYQDNPNRMFNRGGNWSTHLKSTAQDLIGRLPANPVVIDVGCGEGSFLRCLHDLCPTGKYIGFDPNGADRDVGHVHFEQRLLKPSEDISTLKPDAITIRHVLEHLTDPSVLLEEIKWAASQLDKDCLLFVEVPCVDKVVKYTRLADFYYEHVSNFTTRSFHRILERAGDVLSLEHGYGSEVAFATVRLRLKDGEKESEQNAREYREKARAAINEITSQLEALVNDDQSLAVWGGTGKAAAFMQYYEMDADRFPIVVDSDIDKVGTYVPGLGQKIQFRDALIENPVGIIIIPAQWRSKDIVKEIAEAGIECSLILIEHNGRLVDYFESDHPYI
ncbi:MAG: methyltransferase domain-containing protein [Pseudomonadales bacterium]|nr:methyltransferase domain-containing protein [Pseudomonadales bacterium]MBO6596119.1 methyltransferase domain-containing protein [Pseudomonadales bacterium]MBO6822601.1 methyltransferase domain-containing protein [Pseudomonadales bacterium]